LSRGETRIRRLRSFTEERPYVQHALQTQILYDIASILEDMAFELTSFYQEWKMTIPEGRLIQLTVNVTDEPKELSPEEGVSYMPWISFDLYNDGPDPVYVMVNEEYLRYRAPIASGENLKVDMKKPLIRKIWLYCASGQTASVRMYAKR